jgi:hypothetical protein
MKNPQDFHKKIREFFILALQICRVSPYGSTRVVDPSFMAQGYMQRHYTESAICVEP